MSKGKFGIIGVFGLGFGLGAASVKYWPEIEKRLGPLGKEAMKKGLDMVDKAKDAFWEKSEKFADVIAEIKEDQEAESRTGEKPVKPVSN